MDQREEKLRFVVQNLKKKKNTMSISMRIRVVQEMKNLQAEVNTTQEEKQARQT
jgi:hypothetical protein